MNLTSPIRSVIPAVQGDVLVVLARTDAPLTGRQVAAIIGDRVSPKGVNLALRKLVEAGIVDVESHPPANLYSLNRRHLAAKGIEALADLRSRMLTAMRGHLASWVPPHRGGWLFGSAARGDGTATSDVDVLVVRADTVDSGDPDWLENLDRFSSDVTAWTGNPCSIVEYSETEFGELLDAGGPFVGALRADSIALGTQHLRGPTIATGR